jgi:8-oxo-dGTP pyrophosphatase MutT (NUDIX family)
VPSPDVLPPSSHPRIAAGLLIRDAAARVVLVDPTYKPLWDLPGGLVEDGESPAAAAAREVQEELGVSLEVGRMLVVDWAPLGDRDRLLFVFDGGVLDDGTLAQLRVDGEELGAFELVAPQDVPSRVPQRLARRIATALAALNGGERYAEHGIACPS